MLRSEGKEEPRPTRDESAKGRRRDGYWYRRSPWPSGAEVVVVL